MKIQHERTDVERSGTKSESQFTIKATAKSFEILSSALYADKIKAIVRELSCNAYDSHVAAGCAERPIEIFLPDEMEPTFHVKDFGTGLNDYQIRGGYRHIETGEQISLEDGDALVGSSIDEYERFGGIYNTYFESTKTYSDDYIGQLGLGSKSPFSYASTFNVEARMDGVRRIYTCYKDENGFPAISLLGMEPTDEPNGITVTIAVRAADAEKFRQAAKKALMYFNPLPQFMNADGFAPYSLVHTVEGTGWKLRDTEYYAHMSGAHVVQGFVSYPIDTDQLSEAGLSEAGTEICGADIDLFVPIGLVEVAASRESLSYDRRTIVNLIKEIDRISTEVRQSFQHQFDKCQTAWEMGILFDRLANGSSTKMQKIFKRMHTADPFQWNGKDATQTLCLQLDDIKETTLSMFVIKTRRHSSSMQMTGTWFPTEHHAGGDMIGRYDVRVNPNLVLMVNDAGKAFHRGSVSHHLMTLGRRDSAILMFDSMPRKGQCNQAELDEIVRQLGSPPIIKFSEIPFRGTTRQPRAPTRSSQKRDAGQRLVWSGFTKKFDYYDREFVHYKFSARCWDVQEIDLEAGGFYVPINRFEIISADGKFRPTQIDKVIAAAIKLGIWTEGTQIVGLNAIDRKKIDKTTGKWVELGGYLRERYLATNTTEELSLCTVANDVFDEAAIGQTMRTWVQEDWTKKTPDVIDGPFKQVMIAIADVEKKAQLGSINVDAIKQFIAGIGGISVEDRTSISKELVKKWNETVKEYEMLSCISWKKSIPRSLVINYVNLVDATRNVGVNAEAM